MWEITSPLLFDRDNLNHIFSDWRNKEVRNAAGYSSSKQLYQALIEKKSAAAEYVIGLPGVGKTTFAINHLWAQAITTREDVRKLVSMEFDKMIFVTCDVEDQIAQNASNIILLHTSQERIGINRKQRDEIIKNGWSETTFGRHAGWVAKVTTDDTVLISRLKTDYPEKSRIVVYKSNDPSNRDATKDIEIQKLSDKRKYKEEGVVVASGKRTPAQIVHIEHQLKKVLSLSQEKGLTAFAIIGENSWGAYDLGLTQQERIKIINLVLKGQLPFVISGSPKFIKNAHGDVIKIVPEKSRAILGKERLPQWFTTGSTQELIEAYPDFLAHKNAYAVNLFLWYNFINMGDIHMDGSDESISATFIRKCLSEGNIVAIKPYLSPEIFEALSLPHNLQALQRRCLLIQERNQKIKEAKQELVNRYKYTNPLTNQPLLNKKWEPVLLAKKHADKCENRRDQAKIMTYLYMIEEKSKLAEKDIKKKYSKLIYSPENKLLLE